MAEHDKPFGPDHTFSYRFSFIEEGGQQFPLLEERHRFNDALFSILSRYTTEILRTPPYLREVGELGLNPLYYYRDPEYPPGVFPDGISLIGHRAAGYAYIMRNGIDIETFKDQAAALKGTDNQVLDAVARSISPLSPLGFGGRNQLIALIDSPESQVLCRKVGKDAVNKERLFTRRIV